MKKLFFALFVAVLFACNNEAGTDTINTDTVVNEQDNTINRDTSMMSDTSMRRDSM